jgi:long-subunit fatty acid transport protein
LAFEFSNFDGLPNKPDTAIEGNYINLEEQFFTSNLTTPVDWDNAGKVAIGLKYDYNESVTLLAGGSADQSPARKGKLYPQFVDTGDKFGISGGAVFHVNRWDLGVVQSYTHYPDLTVGGLSDFNNDGVFDNFPGDYKPSYYETNLSLTYRF